MAEINAPRATRVPKQQRVFEEATRLFSERGYTGTSIRDIGDAGGILPGSVYAHIEDKHSMLVTMVETGIDQYLEATTDLQGTAEERLRALVDAHVKVIASNVDRALVVYHQWRHIGGADRDRIVGKRREYEMRIERVIAHGKTTGELAPGIDERTAVRGILGTLNWCAEWFSPTKSESTESVSRALADIAARSLFVAPASEQL